MAQQLDTIEMLILTLDNSDFEQRQTIKATLEAMGEMAVDALISAMKTQQGKKAWESADILSRIDDNRRIEPMKTLITTQNPMIGQIVVKTLSTLPTEECVPLFIQALAQAHYVTQLEIIKSLEELDSSVAVPHLLELLSTSTYPVQRLLIIKTLGKLADSSIIPALTPYLYDEDSHVQARTKQVIEELTSKTN